MAGASIDSTYMKGFVPVWRAIVLTPRSEHIFLSDLLPSAHYMLLTEHTAAKNIAHNSSLVEHTQHHSTLVKGSKLLLDVQLTGCSCLRPWCFLSIQCVVEVQFNVRV